MGDQQLRFFFLVNLKELRTEDPDMLQHCGHWGMYYSLRHVAVRGIYWTYTRTAFKITYRTCCFPRDDPHILDYIQDVGLHEQGSPRSKVLLDAGNQLRL